MTPHIGFDIETFERMVRSGSSSVAVGAPIVMVHRNVFKHAVHVASGKTAMVRKGPGRGTTLAQFDDLEHPHAYGWYMYPRNAFKVLR